MGKNLKHRKNTSEQQQLTRKQKRKIQRKQKKLRKDAFYKTKNKQNQKYNLTSVNKSKTKTNNESITNNKVKIQNKDNKQNIKGSQIILKRENEQKNKVNKQKGINNKEKNQKQVRNEQTNIKIKKDDSLQQRKQNSKKVKTKINKSKQSKQMQQQIQKQQRQIQYYEKLLGLDKRKKKYSSVAKKMGYEDDLFDFLDDISKKVKQGVSVDYAGQKQINSNDEQQEEEGSEEGQGQGDEDQDEDVAEYEDNANDQEMQDEGDQGIEGQEDESGEEEYDEGELQELGLYQEEEGQQPLFDIDEEQGQYQNSQDYMQHQQEGAGNLQQQHDENYQDDEDNEDEAQEEVQEEDQEEVQEKDHEPNAKGKKLNHNDRLKAQSQPKTLKPSNSNQPINDSRPRLFGNLTSQQKQTLQIKKQFNSLFNKISDGNLMITFRQFSSIFATYPKSMTIPTFINLFIQFNIQVEKPHLHILLSNIALASALHHLIGNRFMAPLIYEIVKKFEQFENTEEDVEQIEEIGYSRLFEKKKNAILILSYLYDFGSITGEFISSLVRCLAQVLNQHHIEYLYVIIQKIGNKIRQNDPGVLKDIIEVLRQAINKYKSGKEGESRSKMDIIEMQLNELKFNRKLPLFSDQRMAFFFTFINKNVGKQLNSEKEVFLLNYNQVKNANTSRTNWWQHIQNQNSAFNNQNYKDDQQDLEMINELTKQRKQLIQLAKSLNLVTEIRKNIFIQIMEASDYIEATQRVLTLKVRNIQQIAIVLLQACVLQPTFNPFYPLVAAKISNLMPKFKSKVQFAIWDHIKLLQSYIPRKTSNLAKFTARLISNPLTNGSLSILKYFSDLINIPPYQSMFLMIFFTQFLSTVKKSTLVGISKKLKQESNRQIKQSILDYLNEVGVRQKGFGHMDKMKFLRRMILLVDEQMQEER